MVADFSTPVLPTDGSTRKHPNLKLDSRPYRWIMEGKTKGDVWREIPQKNQGRGLKMYPKVKVFTKVQNKAV